MKAITLTSSDNERFEVSEAAASLSEVIRYSIKHDDSAGREISIPVSKVTGEVLAKVLEYCNKHAPAAGSKTKNTTGANGSSSSGAAAGSNEAAEGSSESEAADGAAASGEADSEEELKRFDEAFVDVDQSMLYHLIMAANFLEIRGLLDLACQKVADMISGKKPEEIRKMLRIKDDFALIVEEIMEMEVEQNQCF